MKIKLIKIMLFTYFSCIVSLSGQQYKKEGYLLLDMVHHNPGEPLTKSVFRNPSKIASYNYNGMVINEFIFLQCELTFDKFDKRIFPKKSKEREWVENLTKK